MMEFIGKLALSVIFFLELNHFADSTGKLYIKSFFFLFIYENSRQTFEVSLKIHFSDLIDMTNLLD